ncbi:type II secretion system F family protein [Candidatus Saccharibacteria bacterium]|nr:type II secretion system F family protein [Candidatus Saccharibacteria bacterium]
MLTYHYTARDPKTGEKVNSEVQADNEHAAAKLIKQNGLVPLDISIHEQVSMFGGGRRKRVKIKDKVLFSRQLSTLINAGLPLVQSLRNVAKQTQNKSFQAIINVVIADVEAGRSFSDSLAKHPDTFNAIFINLVAAGEASGTLDKALERLADQQEKDAEIMSKVRGAMIYPLIVLAVMVLVVGFMIIKVLPQVGEIYNGIKGAELPLLTRILLAVSNFSRKYWYVVIIILGVIGFLTSKWARTGDGKLVIDRIKMRAWPFGELFMKLYMARFARTGQTLVAAGVPLIQTLEIVGRSVNNVHIENSIKKATEKVKAGKSLSDALTGDPFFLELVPNMLKIGEESGSLEQMLDKTASYYEKEVDEQIKTISTIIEPLMMVILGIMAFIVVAAILLPIYGLVGKNVVG